MDIYRVLCALAVCSVFREALTCQRRDVEDISQVLADVPDWKGLANWLHIRSSDIEANCAQDVAQAACYRREVVRRYCDSQLSENPSEVAEEIAQALEQMEHKRQAEQLRNLQCGQLMASAHQSQRAGFHTEHWLLQEMEKDKGCATVERESDKQARGAEPTSTKQSVQELADLPPLSGIKTVQANIKHLRNQFKALEDATEADLNNARVHVKSLVKVIFSLRSAKLELHRDFLLKFANEWRGSDTISEVFLRLDTHKYWDYLNIDTLEHIIITFSLPSQTQLEDYKRQLQQFMEQTTVEEFYEAEGDRRHIDLPPAFVKLISQHDWKPPTYLKKVDDFRKMFALEYDLRESAVILVGMWGG